MQNKSAVSRLFITLLLTGFAAHAATIFDITTALTLASPTQTGRLSRNGIPQDWTGAEIYPGVLNTTTTYHYMTFSVNVGLATFIQIDMDSTPANTFASAYLSAYLPDSAGTPNFGFDTDWLGDAGGSGNNFGTDPLYFQVNVPAYSNLIVVVNNTAAGNVGVGDPFHLTVEGFIDSSFTDPPSVPEPSSVLLLGSGLLALALGTLGQRRPV